MFTVPVFWSVHYNSHTDGALYRSHQNNRCAFCHRFSNIHIVRKKISSDIAENEGDVQEMLDTLADSLNSVNTLMDVHPIIQAPDSLQVDIGVFVDTPMLKKLDNIYPDPKDKVTLVLAAYNAVNLLYDDASIGKMRVKLMVKRVHLDDSNSMPKQEKVTDYLSDLCKRYQTEVLAKLNIKKDWDLTTALTGLDVYADAADVTRDAAYKNLRGLAKKIFTVSGGKGGMQLDCCVGSVVLGFFVKSAM